MRLVNSDIYVDQGIGDRIQRGNAQFQRSADQLVQGVVNEAVRRREALAESRRNIDAVLLEAPEMFSQKIQEQLQGTLEEMKALTPKDFKHNGRGEQIARQAALKAKLLNQRGQNAIDKTKEYLQYIEKNGEHIDKLAAYDTAMKRLQNFDFVSSTGTYGEDLRREVNNKHFLIGSAVSGFLKNRIGSDKRSINGITTAAPNIVTFDKEGKRIVNLEDGQIAEFLERHPQAAEMLEDEYDDQFTKRDVNGSQVVEGRQEFYKRRLTELFEESVDTLYKDESEKYQLELKRQRAAINRLNNGGGSQKEPQDVFAIEPIETVGKGNIPNSVSKIVYPSINVRDEEQRIESFAFEDGQYVVKMRDGTIVRDQEEVTRFISNMRSRFVAGSVELLDFNRKMKMIAEQPPQRINRTNEEIKTVISDIVDLTPRNTKKLKEALEKAGLDSSVIKGPFYSGVGNLTGWSKDKVKEVLYERYGLNESQEEQPTQEPQPTKKEQITQEPAGGEFTPEQEDLINKLISKAKDVKGVELSREKAIELLKKKGRI